MSVAKDLTATKRTRAGKGAARAERRQNRVPAVIYGGNEPPLPIALDYATVNQRIYAGHFLSTVVEIDVEGTKIRAIPRDYQLDVVTDRPVHVDFLRITAGVKIRVDVPVHFKNRELSPGLKAGGVINIIHHAIEVMCPPDEIPAEIMVDLAGKAIGDSIHISELTLPPGIKPTNRTDFTVCSIAPPTKEAAPAAATAEAAAGATPAAAEGEKAEKKA
jgi:large subunit ribosomal protein L25